MEASQSIAASYSNYKTEMIEELRYKNGTKKKKEIRKSQKQVVGKDLKELFQTHLRGDRRIVSCERSGAPNSEDGGEDDDDDDDDDGKH